MQNPNFHGILGILKSAAEIPMKNPSFIIFAIFSSLPLFSATLGPELFVQKETVTFIDIFNLVQNLYHFFATQMLFRMLAVKIIETDLLYILFFDLLNLVVTITVVSSASEIYANGGKSTSLKNMLPKSTRSRGILRAVLYKSLWSSVFCIAVSCWVAAGPTIIQKDSLAKVMFFIVLAIASAKWLDYTIKWNIGIVVSILEDVNRRLIISRSEDLIKGNKLRGSLLMLVYFVWWSSSIVLTQNVKGSFVANLGWAFVQSSLICVGKIMLWLVCVVIYEILVHKSLEREVQLTEIQKPKFRLDCKEGRPHSVPTDLSLSPSNGDFSESTFYTLARC
ncbi:hypothetical protein ACFE04_023974 [Oxalis oulophora]